MSHPISSAFSDEQIASLSARIDAQLRTLRDTAPSPLRGVEKDDSLSEHQRQAIQTATGEDAESFLEKFKRAAHHDICREDGVLYKQWRKYRDVTNKDVLQTFGAVLVGMGLSGTGLQVAVVAIAVYVLYIGLTAFCSGD